MSLLIDSLLLLGVAAATSSLVPWLLQHVGALAAENLFLRRQIAMYLDRAMRPRRRHGAGLHHEYRLDRAA